MALVLGSAILLLSSGVSAVGHIFPDCRAGPLATNDVCNKGLTVGERAKALVNALETEEKFWAVSQHITRSRETSTP